MPPVEYVLVTLAPSGVLSSNHSLAGGRLGDPMIQRHSGRPAGEQASVVSLDGTAMNGDNDLHMVCF